MIIPILMCATAGEPVPNFESRKPATDAELRYWLQNMVWDHRFTTEEIRAATGLSASEIETVLKRFDIRPETRPARPEDAPLRMVPWPGGRAVSNWGGTVEPTRQRETKATVFAPWDDTSYVVLDVPEAIFSNIGLLYLAHVDVPTIWTQKGIPLQRLEWNRLPNGLEITRKLPNGVEYHAQLLTDRRAVRMKLTLTNGTDATLTDLRVQNCVFLKGMKGMQNDDEPRVVTDAPYTAYGTSDGKRWVITAWIPFDRCWNNPKNPCFHSDPKFPDCAPGETVTVRGWLSFYEGSDIKDEFERLRKTDWPARP